MLRIAPISIRRANEIVERLHRHNKPVRVARFAVGVVGAPGSYCGAAIERRKAQGKRIDDTFEDYWRIWLDLPPIKPTCAAEDLFAQAGGGFSESDGKEDE